MNYVKDIRRTSRTQREQTRASKDSIGTDWRKDQSTVCRKKGEDGRSESCTVDLGRKKERPEEIAGLSKEEGSEPGCR